MKCGHMFCDQCIMKWIKEPVLYQTPMCPSCRRDIRIEDLRPARDAVIHYINHLMVKCDFAEIGCIVEIRLEDLWRHRSQCPLNPLRPIRCNRGCGLRLPSSEMLKHRCDLDMCQDAIEWNDIFVYARSEMRRKQNQSKSFHNHQPSSNKMIESFKKMVNFFTQWLADPRLAQIENLQQQQHQQHQNQNQNQNQAIVS
ncbi:E3 ubiquitin-protein ligase NRDP1 [Sarcoptes scabiei]|uniref:E3 ubiquitin-protein ligase NRDP1 n=1 Tax=Sarcoptes scabiei TaxID=52283 RepID=A0A834RG20_SARSC|nr:E3 ubiquitin-protein ligase NRDP1 [Sarcoptes scabiei]